MGWPPPPDAPSLDAQASVDASASFEPSPSGPSLCGFHFPPVFSFSLAFHLPKFPPFPWPPLFSFFLSFKCDLSNPIDAEVGFGGGRVGTQDPDPFMADT